MAEKKGNIVRFHRDPKNPPRLTPEQQARLDAMTDEDIDYSDIPETPDDFWTQHPLPPRQTKRQITLRLDPDVVNFFRKGGRGYQSRINAVLRTYMQAVEGTRKRKEKGVRA
jgi:uncharacterized protein (DUF4415 family)